MLETVLAMLVERLPLPLKLPWMLVCHWLKGRATFVLCSNVQVPPAEPLVAVMSSVVPFKTMLVMCGTGVTAGTTLMVPLTARLLVFQSRPAGSVGKFNVLNEPL